jgi:hypothetical protein
MNRASGDWNMHEIVRIVEPAFLINAARQPCRYETAAGTPLDPGYYVALWPKGRNLQHLYTRDVTYCGPLASRSEAELLADRAEVLGLIDALHERGLSGSRLGWTTRWAIHDLLGALRVAMPARTG